MKITVLSLAAALLLLATSCSKENLSTSASGSDSFTLYVIPKGAHSATGSKFQSVEVSELKFMVKFDSSAIYKSVIPENQYDINKLYGFSDNNSQHHQFSARFGWRWSDGALRLFAYTYNNGTRDAKEIGTVNLGTENYCSIKVLPDAYVFTLNKAVVSMPRSGSSPSAKGYQLYPYFGGDEKAPHDVRIWIKEVK